MVAAGLALAGDGRQRRAPRCNGCRRVPKRRMIPSRIEHGPHRRPRAAIRPREKVVATRPLPDRVLACQASARNLLAIVAQPFTRFGHRSAVLCRNQHVAGQSHVQHEHSFPQRVPLFEQVQPSCVVVVHRSRQRAAGWVCGPHLSRATIRRKEGRSTCVHADAAVGTTSRVNRNSPCRAST